MSFVCVFQGTGEIDAIPQTVFALSAFDFQLHQCNAVSSAVIELVSASITSCFKYFWHSHFP